MSAPQSGNKKTQQGRLRSRSGAQPWGLLICAAILFAVLVCLGIWQTQRLFWKEQLIAGIDQRIHAAPKTLAQAEAGFMLTGSVDYMPVTLRGTFAHDHEQYFFTTFKGVSGYAVYTPLLLADGRAVFINRGFVPYEKQKPETRLAGQVTGEVTINGLARDPLIAKPSFYLPDNEPDKKLYYWKDWGTMMENSGLSQAHDFVGFFVDADASPNPGGLPAGGITILELPNNHLQYAVTWFGLAAVLLVITVIFVWRRRNI
ncbi:SURF1 family protein [Pseudochrobactrum sp. HB0163]|uniref:SURF1 family protein n=1 Tax=Pseudochrobactrum sp. HB0163 TaxID=3450708 RepID=UPI003F6DED3F